MFCCCVSVLTLSKERVCFFLCSPNLRVLVGLSSTGMWDNTGRLRMTCRNPQNGRDQLGKWCRKKQISDYHNKQTSVHAPNGGRGRGEGKLQHLRGKEEAVLNEQEHWWRIILSLLSNESCVLIMLRDKTTHFTNILLYFDSPPQASFVKYKTVHLQFFFLTFCYWFTQHFYRFTNRFIMQKWTLHQQ